nr:MAG TPA: DNA polymerase B Like Replicative Helicase [Caudoviricetes sp.]
MSSRKEIVLRLKDIGSTKEIKNKKIKIPMDVYFLDSMLGFIYKDSVLKTKKTLANFLKVFNMLDESFYDDKPAISARIWVAKKTLEFILQEKVEDLNMIKSSLMEDPECQGLRTFIIEDLDNKNIGYEESKKLIRMMDDRLRFGYIATVKEIYRDILDYIDEDDYKTFKEVQDIIYQVSTAVIQLKRNSNSLESDSTFSLETEKFEACVTDAVTRLQDKMKVLKTGITRLNTILAPGYLSKRLYMYLAFPGGGKSQILLKSALDIKKYNRVTPKNPENHPCVLYITMENSIEETIERMFNMCVSSDDIRNYTPKQVIKKLREGGQLQLTDENNMNIIMKYYPNKSITTDDLYGIINDLEDEGNEVVSLILDYVKRIRSAERAKDEKEELKNVTNELKNLAAAFDISVITAQQLNRSSASVIDSAMQAKKEDLAKLIGRDAVGSAWEINSIVSAYRKVC